MLNKDSYVLGIVLGAISPWIMFGFLYLLLIVIDAIAGKELPVKLSALQIASITIDLFILRYYFVNRKFERTGRGILIMAFIYFMVFFIFIHKWQA
jgi:hypothetical protein